VGDSRCYLLRAGTLRRCTRDHSLVEEQVRLGQLTPAQAAASPMRHVITRAVGVRRSVAVELQELDIEPGDLFLLCSDGLTRELDEVRIAELLASLPYEAGGDAHLAEALVREALAAGGGDNITCLTVHMA
jgi:protein phosphatase